MEDDADGAFFLYLGLPRRGGKAMPTPGQPHAPNMPPRRNDFRRRNPWVQNSDRADGEAIAAAARVQIGEPASRRSDVNSYKRSDADGSAYNRNNFENIMDGKMRWAGE
eukprot:SAG11_NODE_14873_length_597_cov_0.714859_1_plen_108_part_01